MLERQRGYDLGDELVVRTEAKLWVREEHIKLLLETVEQLILHKLDSNLGRQVVKAVILRQKGVGRSTEVLTRVKLPSVDGAAVDSLVAGQLPADFDNQVLDLVDHVTGILSR